MRHEDLIAAVGHTPLVRLRFDEAPEVKAYAKLELQNLFAMKDRVARQVILDARESGELAQGAPIVESSSGTMALGLALVGTYLGHPVHIVTDPRIDPITLSKLDALGCQVHVVEAMTSQGWQSARLERLGELMSGLPGAFWPRQYSNPGNPLAYRTLAAELTADVSTLDVIVGSVGSGGSLCGTSRALLEDLPDLTVIGVDCVGSLLFAQPDRPQRKQSGLGNSLQPENIDYSILDEVHWLSDDEAFAATRALAREQKIFAGNTSGSVYRVLSHLARRAQPGTCLVGIFPDRGDRYVDSVFRASVGPIRTEPVEVSYGTPVTEWSLAKLGRNARRRLVFVESNTTGTGMMALRTAARLGVEPVLLTDKPARYAGLRETRCRVIETATADASAVHELLETLGPLAGVTTTSEYYLELCARLAEAHGLPGNPHDAVIACRNKILTRKALTAAGLPQPRSVFVADPSEAVTVVARIGLPCVVKPVDGSGSELVRLCSTVDAVAEQVAQIVAVKQNARGLPTAGVALIEEFIDGPEHSVEMFSNGGHHLIGVTRKHLGPPPYFVETGHLFPEPHPPHGIAETVETVEAALNATGFRSGATHTELRQSAGGPVVIEINARLAGGMIPELVRLATGVDVLEQQLRAAIGLPLLLEATRQRYAGIRFLLADEPGTLKTVHGVEKARRVQGVDRVVVTASPGANAQPARDFSHRLGYVIAAGAVPGEVDTALSEALSQLRIELS